MEFASAEKDKSLLRKELKLAQKECAQMKALLETSESIKQELRQQLADAQTIIDISQHAIHGKNTDANETDARLVGLLQELDNAHKENKRLA